MAVHPTQGEFGNDFIDTLALSCRRAYLGSLLSLDRRGVGGVPSAQLLCTLSGCARLTGGLT